MLGRATYLGLMVACLLANLPLELVLKAGGLPPRLGWPALVPVFLAFSLWTGWPSAAAMVNSSQLGRTASTFSARPLEELVFFLVVPTCASSPTRRGCRRPPGPHPGNAPR